MGGKHPWEKINSNLRQLQHTSRQSNSVIVTKSLEFNFFKVTRNAARQQVLRYFSKQITFYNEFSCNDVFRPVAQSRATTFFPAVNWKKGDRSDAI